MHLAYRRDQARVDRCKFLRLGGGQYPFDLDDWRMAAPPQLCVHQRPHLVQQLMKGTVPGILHRMARRKGPRPMMVANGFPASHADQDRFPSTREEALRR